MRGFSSARSAGLGVIVSVLACACTDDAKPADEASATEAELGATESGETGEAGPLLLGDPTVVRHPDQPMVIDVLVELDAPGTGMLVHTSDDEVRVAQLAPGPSESATTLHFRVRGLLPDASHPLALTVAETDGDRTGSWAGEIATDPALPGFIAKFEIATDDSSLVSDDLRLFDMGRMFSTEPAGLFLVDNEGTTRWYLADVDEYTDLEDVWTGVRLRADGSVSCVRDYTAFVVDELGETRMAVTAASIGAPAGLHHDLTELPNGNFLVLGYSFADVEYEGEGTLHVAGDMIYEITPAGDVVWSWDTFDHLDPQRRRDGFFNTQKIPDPEAMQEGYDWTHANGVVYDDAEDTIYLSLRHQDWLLAIDHATGDVLWKLGDEGDFTLVDDAFWFFHQHSPEWQADGTLLLYDNGVGNPAQTDSAAHSRAVQYAIDVDAMTATMIWADDDPKFVSSIAGDADRMSNGNVLRLDSMWVDEDNQLPGSRLHELDPSRSPNLVWSLVAPPQRFVYRAVPVTRFVGEPL